MDRPRRPARPHPAPAGVSLARALSKLGYCSRAQARELIAAGRVRVRGTVRRDPEWRVRLGSDGIEVDERPLAAERRVYLMLNKPRGLVTTRSDEQGRPTVYACLPPEADLPHLSPVGRLDRASEGLLLFTNDTRWAARVLDPATHLEKTYHVQVDRRADEALLRALAEGSPAADGERLRARDARLLRQGTRNSWLEIVLDEGRNRHIRRLLEGLGVEVLRLVRVAIGPLPLGDLPRGAARPLSPGEKAALDAAMAAAGRPRAAG